MKINTVTLVLSLLLGAAGCTPGAHLSTPAGFATLDSGDMYSYRATSAKGVVLATRTEPNRVKANTEFWADTLDGKLRDKGYTADGAARAVKTSKGLAGTQLRYTTMQGGRVHRYWVSVFATADKVYLVEAAGDKEPFDKAEKTVESAMSTLDATP